MTEYTLDTIDIRIINELQNNASLTNSELSMRVNLSPSPCLVRVKRLEKLGIIDRRVALVNPAAVGLNVSAYVTVKFDNHSPASTKAFYNFINQTSEIMECHLVTGDCEYKMRVLARDIEDLDHIIFNRLGRLDGVSSIKSSIILRQIRSKTALPIKGDVSVSTRARSVQRDMPFEMAS